MLPKGRKNIKDDIWGNSKYLCNNQSAAKSHIAYEKRSTTREVNRRALYKVDASSSKSSLNRKRVLSSIWWDDDIVCYTNIIV